MKILLLRCAAILSAATGSAHAQAVYTISFTGSSSTFYDAINDNGFAAGRDYGVTNYPRAAIANWTDGTHGAFLNLLAGGSNDDLVSGFNNAGRAVGYGNTATGDHAAYYDLPATGPINLGTLGGSNSYATGVNASGQIVGYSQVTGNGANNAFLWNSGTLSSGNSLGTLGGANSYGYAINPSGQVVGSSDITGNSAKHAFRTSANGLVSAGLDLGTLGGTNSYAYAVNSSGQVAGASQISGDATTHAFLYTSGSTVDLGVAAGFTSSSARGVNDNGIVTGVLDAVSGLEHGFVYANGTLFDLNSLVITGVPAGWNIEEANAINSSGQIVGTLHDTTQYGYHAFVLTPTGAAFPIPEPATYAVFVGVAMLGFAAWRRQRGAV